MSRSKWKHNTTTHSILKKIKISFLKKLVLGRLVFTRNLIVPTEFEGSQYFIYNGIIFNRIRVNESLEGKKFGEFSTTKKPFFFPKKNKKKR